MAPGAPRADARNATVGVGTTPASSTSAPSEQMPATRAASISGPDRRVSRPITNGVSVPRTRAAARPRAVTSSGVSSRLATPRMPSVPNRRVTGRAEAPRASALALRVLGRFTGLLEAVLAPFLLARVAHEQSGLLELRTHLVVERDEGAGDPESQGAGLAADAAAVDGGVDVVHVVGLGQSQRFGGALDMRQGGEVLLDGAAVDDDFPRTGAESHAGDGFLASAGRLYHCLGHFFLS